MAAAILSDQKSYGLWRLFSVSVRASKLLPDGPVGLSSEAREFVERQNLPPLGPALTELRKLIVKAGDVILEPLDPVLERLRDVDGVEHSPAEREFYRSYVCDGSRCDQLPAGRQRAFRRLLQSHSALHRNVNRDDFVLIRKAAQGQDPELARRIGHVIALESLVVPCEALFGLLQTRHGQPATEVAATLSRYWGTSVRNLTPAELSEIASEIARVVDTDIRDQMARVHEALLTGRFRTAIEHCLEWNRLVMMRRSSSPWVLMDNGERLEVRYRRQERALSAAEERTSLWRYTCFADSLKALVIQTFESPRGNAL